MKSRKKRVQKSRRWAGSGSVGHGTITRIKPLDKLRNTIANYKNEKNHLWGKFIVNEAIKNEVETIQMENLAHISTQNKFLKRWTYYDLQEKIKYKAKKVRIHVIKVTTAYTSARCNRCGAIHRHQDKKIWRKNTSSFHCMNCGHQDHADANASKNLSMKEIDKIIQAEKSSWFEKFNKSFPLK